MELRVSCQILNILRMHKKNLSDETFQVFVIDDCKLISTANKTRTKKLPDKVKYAFIFYDLGLWLGSVGSVCGVR